MSTRLNVTLSIEVEDHETPIAELEQQLGAAMEERYRAGIFGPDDEVELLSVRTFTGTPVAEQLAELSTWEHSSRVEAIDEYGYTDPEEIEQHAEGRQTDLDYLTGQDNELERLIGAAREETGHADDPSIAQLLAKRGISEEQPEP